MTVVSVSSRPRISIVTSGPLCRNPRPLKEARALGGAGYDVTVFTVAHRATYEQTDAELIGGAPFRKIALDTASSPAHPRLRSFTARATTWVARRMARYGVETARALGPVDRLTRLVRSRPAHLTVVHTELGLAVGRRLRRSGRAVGTDFEDWHSHDLLPTARKSRPLWLLEQLEREALNDSSLTFTTSDALAGALVAHYGGNRPLVIRNTFPLQPPPPPVPVRSPTFFWFSQTVGPGRGLENLVAAWCLMKTPTALCLLGDPTPGYGEDLRRRVPARRRAYLRLMPPVHPAELPSVIARHDIGLALEQMTPASRNLTTTNKLFQYLNAGLAVVATDTAGQREVAREANGGIMLVNLDDPVALADTLDKLARDPARIDAMRRASRSAAEQMYCWEKDEPRLLAAVAATLERISA